jgi:hypothetical protein
MTVDDLAREIAAHRACCDGSPKHRKHRPYCWECKDAWPCLLSRLANERARLREAGDNLAAVAGPTVDVIQELRESENAQNLALLLALQVAAWRDLTPPQADVASGLLHPSYVDAALSEVEEVRAALVVSEARAERYRKAVIELAIIHGQLVGEGREDWQCNRCYVVNGHAPECVFSVLTPSGSPDGGGGTTT